MESPKENEKRKRFTQCKTSDFRMFSIFCIPECKDRGFCWVPIEKGE